jgi:hypothetical protein
MAAEDISPTEHSTQKQTMAACVQLMTMTSDYQIEESIAIAEELSSLLAKKHSRSVEPSATGNCHFGEQAPRRAKKQRVKKNVRFAEDKVWVFDEEHGCSWYHEQDYQRIKQENRDTLIAIARAKGKLGDIDANSYCVRGLELQIGITLLNMAPYGRQKIVVKRVLDLQDKQRSQKIIDADALREISRTISMEDKFKAWRTASIDAFRN